jgi:hypothetical protein
MFCVECGCTYDDNRAQCPQCERDWRTIFPQADPTLIERFVQYHAGNPHVYREFASRAHHMKNVRERKHYSQWTIICSVRYDIDKETKNHVFKINNDFIALYVRLLIHDSPEYDGFFELRRMKPFGRKMSNEERRRTNDAEGAAE